MPRSLQLVDVEGAKPGKVYYPLQIKQVPKPTPGPDEVLVRMTAAALNHRDLFIRQHLYPNIDTAKPLLADGCGVVVELGAGVAPSLLHQSVILTPSRGWDRDPQGPEDPSRFVICGSQQGTDAGCAADYVLAPATEVEPMPAHLSPVEAAALPLVGLTGWRALVTKAGIDGPGKNVLITGIGGGVALQVLQFVVALGSNAYVTSGDQAKIERAVAMGARGGVLYTAPRWGSTLKKTLLPRDRPWLDAVVDGAGGSVVQETAAVLRHGGVIAQYGMTVGPKMEWLMKAVLANIDLRGSTMGSRREFRDMVAFVNEHRIKPVVSQSIRGLGNLEQINGLFDVMAAGRQFGKLVIEIDDEAEAAKL
ncbi:alcohol dehydrogenase [Cordyceps militaris CM01]|uniref:Alcohol dehydrogenase n=1 Tax=Cordyceps militaris (strain CM01) TaxID=983644 RepID=G3JSY8_CORMM|nr:alcohol dehydrogenase [Cordyceps militaris CM01]EGX88984.1 alcohol dehydrogenase [Cordyceps militaris CM01]